MIFLWMLCVALMMALTVLVAQYRMFRKRMHARIEMQSKMLVDAYSDYVALEKGRDEESEAYEQMYLSWQEGTVRRDGTISTLQKDREVLFSITMWHELHCLPDLELLQINGIVNKEDLDDIKLRMGVPVG